MSQRDVLQSNLRRAAALYDDLISRIPEAALGAKLPGIRSNTIGQQLWCVIGARESYTRALAAGEWKGFSCSVTKEQIHRRDDLAEALTRSAARLLDAFAAPEPLTDAQLRLLLDLVEHEAAHHGQLIRYLYALNLEIPASWKSRYALQ